MSVPYYGDFAEDDTVLIPFNTFSSDDPSASVTITNLADADIKVHKDGGTTEIATDGATVAINFDSRTGAHLITVDTSAHSDYSTGSEYAVLIEGTTVDAGTITAWVGAFSIERAGGALAIAKLIQTAVITNAAGADVAADIIAVKAETANILTDTGTTLQGELDAIQAAVITNAAGTDIAADIIAVKAETATILTDTADIQPRVVAIETDTGTTLENRLIAIEADTDVIDDGTSGLIKIASDVAAVLVDTGTTIPGTITTMQGNVTDILTDTGTTLQAELDGIQADTEDLQTQIGTAGAGLTDLGGMSTGMKAEVEAEALDALEGVQLDHLVGVTTGVAADGDLTTYCVDGSVISHIMTAGANTSDYNASTDALEVSGGGDATEAKQDSIIAAVITNAAGADVAADIIAVKAETATIVADTNELQADDIPGTLSTIEGKVDTIDGIVDNILTDTGTTLQAELDGIQADTEDLQTQIGTAGAGLTAVPYNSAWNADIQSECTDALNAYDPPTKAELDTAQGAVTLANGAHGGAAASITLADYSDFTGAGAENPNVLLSSEIDAVTNQTTFTLVTGSDQDDAYNDQAIVLYDDTNSDYPSIRVVSDYTGASKTVVIDSAPDFTLGTDDSVKVFVTAPGSTAPSAASIVNEWETQSQADPTGFHVNVIEVGGTAQTANDNGADINAILTDTNELQTDDIPGTLSTMDGKINTIDGIVDNILTDTGTTLQAELDGIQADTEDLQTQIGAAGAGLSAIPWNASWDAEVQSECADALTVYDPPTKAEMDTGHGLLATEAKQDTIDGIVDTILVDTADMQPRIAAIEVDTGTTLQGELDGIQADTEDIQTQIGAAGAGLSAVPWNAAWDAEVQSECTDALNAYDPPTKAEMDTGHGLLATEAKQDVIDTVVDGIQTDLDNGTDGLGALKALIDALENLSAAEVNAEVLDVLNVDTFVEPGDEKPTATTTLVDKIGYLYKFLRNKVESTSTRIHVYDDAGTNKDQTSTISDDGATFTRGEFGAGDA